LGPEKPESFGQNLKNTFREENTVPFRIFLKNVEDDFVLLHRPDVLDVELTSHLCQLAHRHRLELRDVYRARLGQWSARRLRAFIRFPAVLAFVTITAIVALPSINAVRPVLTDAVVVVMAAMLLVSAVSTAITALRPLGPWRANRPWTPHLRAGAAVRTFFATRLSLRARLRLLGSSVILFGCSAGLLWLAPRFLDLVIAKLRNDRTSRRFVFYRKHRFVTSVVRRSRLRTRLVSGRPIAIACIAQFFLRRDGFSRRLGEREFIRLFFGASSGWRFLR